LSFRALAIPTRRMSPIVRPLAQPVARAFRSSPRSRSRSGGFLDRHGTFPVVLTPGEPLLAEFRLVTYASAQQTHPHRSAIRLDCLIRDGSGQATSIPGYKAHSDQLQTHDSRTSRKFFALKSSPSDFPARLWRSGHVIDTELFRPFEENCGNRSQHRKSRLLAEDHVHVRGCIFRNRRIRSVYCASIMSWARGHFLLCSNQLPLPGDDGCFCHCWDTSESRIKDDS
jgi:hypothetical protein